MRSRSIIEFLGLWEKLCNPGFRPLEFERFRNEAGSNLMGLRVRRFCFEPENLAGLADPLLDPMHFTVECMI